MNVRIKKIDVTQKRYAKNLYPIWPHVSNIWSIVRRNKPKNANHSEVYICCLNKRSKSSTCQEDVPTEKRRKTKIRDSDLCFAKMKVTHLSQVQMVRVEHYDDSPGHTHTLTESDILKRPEAIKNLVASEATKPYRPLEIINTIEDLASKTFGEGTGAAYLHRKEVSNIQSKLRGHYSTPHRKHKVYR